MTILVFDLDDTLLMSNSYNKYDDIREHTNLNEQLNNYDCKKFIYTNGTYGHAISSLKNMNSLENFSDIFARDTLQHYKPNPKSFNEVCNILYHSHNLNDNIIFFDDLPSNLQAANYFNWTTVWIHPSSKNYNIPNYIDYSFPDIITALKSLKN